MIDATPADIRSAVAAAPLEWLLTRREAFGLTTATPLQRGICRLVEGRPLGHLAALPIVRKALGGAPTATNPKPIEVVILGAVRSGKSLLSASGATRMSQQCDLSRVRESETPRINVVSLDKDKARVVLDDHLIGTLRGSWALSQLVAAEPKSDRVFLRHPSGRTIEVMVVAGRRAGGSLVSRWSAGTIFDEAPRMVGRDDGVLNLEDNRQAVLGRLLPGAQVWYVGSPHAPFGPVYDLYSQHFGAPVGRYLVVKATGPDMNPAYWTPEKCEELRQADPDAYRTDVLGEFLTPDEALFSHVVLERAVRKDPLDLPRDALCTYRAGMDPATRGNGWTLVLATEKQDKALVALCREWRGSKTEPLSPRKVLKDIAAVCHRYGVTRIRTDQYSIDALQDLASDVGLTLEQDEMTESERSEQYLSMRARFVEGEIELPPDRTLLADLRRVRRRATQSGISIDLPDTGDGRHCDYAPALMLALSQDAPELSAKPREHPEVVRMRKAVEKKWRRAS